MRRTFGESGGAEAKRNETVRGRTNNIVLKSAVAMLAVLLVVSSALAVFEYNEALSLQSIVSERDNALTERGKAITWLDTALNLTQTTLNLKPPNGSQYLKMLPDPSPEGNPTKIFLVSTVPGYAYDPYSWPFTNELRNALVVPTDNGSVRLPDFGWHFFPGNYGFTFHGGGGAYPVLMIGVTVRNDYTPADAGNDANLNASIGTNPFTNISASWISLTVKFFDQNGSIVQAAAANVTQAPTAIGGRKFALGSGETAQVVFYFTPPSLEVDHYEIYISYLSANW